MKAAVCGKFNVSLPTTALHATLVVRVILFAIWVLNRSLSFLFLRIGATRTNVLDAVHFAIFWQLLL